MTHSDVKGDWGKNGVSRGSELEKYRIPLEGSQGKQCHSKFPGKHKRRVRNWAERAPDHRAHRIIAI